MLKRKPNREKGRTIFSARRDNQTPGPPHLFFFLLGGGVVGFYSCQGARVCQSNLQGLHVVLPPSCCLGSLSVSAHGPVSQSIRGEISYALEVGSGGGRGTLGLAG